MSPLKNASSSGGAQIVIAVVSTLLSHAVAEAQPAAVPPPLAPPAGFVRPPLNPNGAVLTTNKLGQGVYALMSSKPFTDNGGFIVGERGVLVIDANFNARMANAIQSAVRQVTQKPILFLVNTNGFPDHTFGNYVFPADTHIIGHRLTVEIMTDLSATKQRMLATVDNDATVYADAQWRRPDIIFDDHLRIDLGGKSADIYYFGPGNTPGDTVVYERETQTAWTGNLVFGEGTIPWMNSGTATAYGTTLARFANTLTVQNLIPGHGSQTTGRIVDHYRRYLADLERGVRSAIEAGQSLPRVLETSALPSSYLDTTPQSLRALMIGFHQWNVQRAYQTIPLSASAGRGQ